MPSDVSRLLRELSRTDLERLLAAKGEIEELEQRRDALQKELAEVERRLEQLAGDATGRGTTSRPGRATRKKARTRTAQKAEHTTSRKIE